VEEEEEEEEEEDGNAVFTFVYRNVDWMILAQYTAH